jgi:hypothetical protein
MVGRDPALAASNVGNMLRDIDSPGRLDRLPDEPRRR